MTRLLTDGAESGDTSRWTGTVAGQFGASISIKRTGGYAYFVNGGTLQSGLFTAATEFYARFAFYSANTAGVNIFYFQNSGSTSARLRVGAWGTGIATLLADDGTTNRATSSFITLNPAEWHVIEVHIKHAANPNGVFQVKFDGTQVINYTGTMSAQSQTNQVFLPGTGNSNNTIYVDDIAVNDLNTGSDASWIGDGGVLAALVPNGAGNYTDLLASAGTAYQCIDEIPSNGNTDYVQESTVDKKSTYTMADVAGLPTGASIARVWMELSAEQSAAGGDKIATLLRSGTHDDQSADKSLTTAYARYLSAEYLTDPQDSAAWTSTKVNALEAGAVVR